MRGGRRSGQQSGAGRKGSVERGLQVAIVAVSAFTATRGRRSIDTNHIISDTKASTLPDANAAFIHLRYERVYIAVCCRRTSFSILVTTTNPGSTHRFIATVRKD